MDYSVSMKYTKVLQAILSSYQQTLSEEEYRSFSQEVERLVNHYHELLSASKAGSERAQVTQQLIDEQNLLNSHIKISCQKGCGACCHLEVEITADDANLLARSILQQKIPYDKARLQEQAQRSRLDSAWKKGVVAANRCVMLGDDNACSNYENRPATCRKLSVTSPPEYCAPSDQPPVPVIAPMSEIIMSASISFSDNEFGSLPKMLAQALERLQSVEAIRQLDFAEDKSVLDEIVT